MVNLIKDGGEETSITIPDAPNAGVALQESHITELDDAVRDKLQSMEVDDSTQEKGRELPLRVSEEPRDDDVEENVSSADLVAVKEMSPEVSKKFRTEFSEPDVSSENLEHRVTSEKEVLQASQPYSKENSAYTHGNYVVESEEAKPSPKSLSLKPQESTCPDSVRMTSCECESIPEICQSNDRLDAGGCNANQDNSASAQDSESAQTHVDINSPSSSASHHDHVARRPYLQPRYSRNSGGNWHQTSGPGKFRKDTKFGYHGHGYRKQHQQQQLSPPKSRPPEGGFQMSKASGYPSQPALQIQPGSQGQNQFQSTANPDFIAAHSWPMQSVPLQNSVSQSQPPAMPATSQLSQDAMQGHMQNAQAYNQMWQYYYYQQQQQFLLQQQQQMQPQQALLLQQQYQQQLQQYIQYQQQSFQQQNQPEHLQLQQPQQLQLQEQVLMQHQQQQPLQQECPVYPQQQPSSQSQVQQKDREQDQEQKQYNQSTTSPHSQPLDYSRYQQVCQQNGIV